MEKKTVNNQITDVSDDTNVIYRQNAINWCHKHIDGINLTYAFNENNELCIHGDARLKNINFTKIPYKIYKVDGDFIATSENIQMLETLENFPEIVTGDFSIAKNKKICSLEHGPIFVGGRYICNHCGLMSLKGIAKEINEHIVAYSNPFTDISDLLNVSNYDSIDLSFCYDIVKNDVYKTLKSTGKIYTSPTY